MAASMMALRCLPPALAPLHSLLPCRVPRVARRRRSLPLSTQPAPLSKVAAAKSLGAVPRLNITARASAVDAPQEGATAAEGVAESIATVAHFMAVLVAATAQLGTKLRTLSSEDTDAVLAAIASSPPSRMSAAPRRPTARAAPAAEEEATAPEAAPEEQGPAPGEADDAAPPAQVAPKKQRRAAEPPPKEPEAADPPARAAETAAARAPAMPSRRSAERWASGVDSDGDDSDGMAGGVVYVTSGGWQSKKYHTSRCQHVNRAAGVEEVPFEELEGGWTECKTCAKKKN